MLRDHNDSYRVHQLVYVLIQNGSEEKIIGPCVIRHIYSHGVLGEMFEVFDKRSNKVEIVAKSAIFTLKQDAQKFVRINNQYFTTHYTYITRAIPTEESNWYEYLDFDLSDYRA